MKGLTDSDKVRFVNVLAETGSVVAAANYIPGSRAKLYYWRQKDEPFRHAWDRASDHFAFLANRRSDPLGLVEQWSFKQRIRKGRWMHRLTRHFDDLSVMARYLEFFHPDWQRDSGVSLTVKESDYVQTEIWPEFELHTLAEARSIPAAACVEVLASAQDEPARTRV